MTQYLHRLSATFFSILTGSFFLAYVLYRNEVGGTWPQWWLSAMDMPLLLCALLFGGLSIYRSLSGDTHSRTLALGIGIPFTLIFLLALIVNYLPTS